LSHKADSLYTLDSQKVTLHCLVNESVHTITANSIFNWDAEFQYICTISVSIPGRGFSFPGIREWPFSFPGARDWGILWVADERKRKLTACCIWKTLKLRHSTKRLYKATRPTSSGSLYPGGKSMNAKAVMSVCYAVVSTQLFAFIGRT